jgi:enolase-phosphatase E1
MFHIYQIQFLFNKNNYLCTMISNKIQFILTDIEGTTTSVSFVYDVLFPYFRTNLGKVRELKNQASVDAIFQDVVSYASSEEVTLNTESEIINKLMEWSLADKKITPLKTLQGLIWEEGYHSGELKGHVYPDVAQALMNWKNKNIQLGVFSSGSIAAQKLIFGYSVEGDLATHFSNYFDTTTGGKREVETYQKIEKTLEIKAENILFLSDIVEELEAAKNAGFQTIQLVREGNTANWPNTVSSFDEISIK